MKQAQIDALRLKHPNSSTEEIDALHAQLYPESAGEEIPRLAEINQEISAARGSRANPHPDTSAANAELEAARNAKKPRKRPTKKK